MKSLHVVVPGLLGPFSDALPVYIQQQLQQSEFRQINNVLSRAKITSNAVQSNLFETLVNLIHPQCELSLCQLTAAYDELDTSDGFYYRADPVHFKAESDHAILIGTDLVQPNRQEAQQLIESFNLHFLEDNLSLHFTSENRWYLKSENSLDLSFTSLDYALGRDIKHFMPQDTSQNKPQEGDALWWRKVLNEAQMLFFQHAANQNREQSGGLAINGLWLWDMQARAVVGEQNKIDLLFSDDVLAIALANQSNIDIKPTDEIENIISSSVLVLDSLYESVCYGDVDAWLNALMVFAENEFKKILFLLSSKKVDEIKLYPCTGKVITVNRLDLLKFWKTSITIDEFISIS